MTTRYSRNALEMTSSLGVADFTATLQPKGCCAQAALYATRVFVLLGCTEYVTSAIRIARRSFGGHSTQNTKHSTQSTRQRSTSTAPWVALHLTQSASSIAKPKAPVYIQKKVRSGIQDFPLQRVIAATLWR